MTCRTALIVPMLRNDELTGTLGVGRRRTVPFTENEIELVTDFAAEAAIALEITRRERELCELQMQLAHTNRVVTMEELSASITHEVNQPIAAASNNVVAALHFLDRNLQICRRSEKRSPLLWPRRAFPSRFVHDRFTQFVAISLRCSLKEKWCGPERIFRRT
ncbi:GAF domain-containing protein [Bradyrhizobium sp. Ec3.3]|uniref:GAF domain-containing protein n=1 Tax=Bradyrhizobium sp. Ec3.3 TaxID=189753 RepID=UPI0021103CAC|nr:GAF domain-containing protein [Bradyrhizobium sp. Ec3.3]